MAEIVLQNPAALLLIPALWLLVMAFAWRRRFKPFGAFLLRLAIIVLVGLALAQPTLVPDQATTGATQERLVLLVDQSASISAADQQAFAAQVARLTAQFPHAIVVYYFADQPIVAKATSSEEQAAGERSLSLDPSVTNLAQALATGIQLLNDQPGRLVLFSDGVSTTGNTQEMLARLARQHIPVDVFIPASMDLSNASDVRLVELTVPATLRPGEIFDVEVIVHAPRATQAQLVLTQDKASLNKNTVPLDPGFNRFTFETEIEELGLHTFEATVTTANDSQPANNRLSATSKVFPSPQILIVGDNPPETATFAGWLEKAGFIPQTIPSADLPDRLSALEVYDGMVLLNVSARLLKLEQMIAVQEFVRSLGRGLLVTGGRNSFSLGKYEDTPLAEVIPLSLDPPIREERPPVTLLLIIDHSGSMVEERGELGTRLVLAKESAIRATNILGPQDVIGILIFDTDYEWALPFQKVSDGATLLKIQEEISKIKPGSATRILAALREGIPALVEQESISAARHVVLFSDGTSYDKRDSQNPDNPIPDYDAIVDAALAADVTLSTVSIGGDTDVDLMARLADRGRGRYHYAGSPDELPELTIAESDILRSNAVQEGDYDPAAPAPHSILRGFVTAGQTDPDNTGSLIPPLTGYIAMTPKLQAETALQAGPGDPLLGVWGYGLGRVAAWSSDTGHEWTNTWKSWPDAARFWGQVVDYTLPAPDLGLLELQAEVEPNGVVTFSADGVTASGQTVDLSRTEATLTTPGGREVPLTLLQVSPGRYQQRLKIADPGAYQLQVTQTRTEQSDETVAIGFTVPYPAEYSLPDDDAGEPLLRKIANQTGGQVLRSDGGDPADTALIDVTATTPKTKDLWPWLLWLALMLWPVEIAWRRWGRLRIQ
ncbi:MAG: VWA domain-containing protein [Anaerolineae bacterium]|nr:VWA domain-containing protein [Anaerolineae bacterium]